MELIFANHDREDVGILKNPELDLAFGGDENNFECTVGIKDHCCEDGFYIYAEGTEYGGIVDAIKIDSADDTVTYSGRTWHGMLASKFLPEGLILSGDANACIKNVLDTIDLSPLFVSETESTGVQIDTYTLTEYTDAYTVLCDMLEEVGLRLRTECFEGVVTLSAVPIFDFSADKEMESDLIEYQMMKKYRKVNHLICIGLSGTVVHLYVDEEGHISEEQTFVGIDEYAAVDGEKFEEWENSGITVENEREELVKHGKKVLAGMLKENTITVQFEPEDDAYYIGDIVGAYDRMTEISVSARVSKKILSLANGKAEIEYKVGEQ